MAVPTIKTPVTSPRDEALPCVQPDSASDQSIAVTDTSAASTAVTSTVVRLVGTVACHVAFGANPTATTSNLLLPANAPEYFTLEPGWKVAVIKASGAADGTLSLSEASLVA